MIKNLFSIILIFSQSIVHPKTFVELSLYKADNKTYICLNFTIENGWHLYWLNSGDTGIPTEITWNLPDGIEISNELWPIPKAFEVDGLVSYGYENNASIFYEIIFKDYSEIHNKDITCKIKSLICKDVCIPFDTVITFNLSNLKSRFNQNELKDLLNNQFPNKEHSLELFGKIEGDKVLLEIKNNLENETIESFSFFPFENGIFKNVLENEFYKELESYIIKIEFDPFRTHIPEKLEGILILFYSENNSRIKKSFEISVPLKYY